MKLEKGIITQESREEKNRSHGIWHMAYRAFDYLCPPAQHCPFPHHPLTSVGPTPDNRFNRPRIVAICWTSVNTCRSAVPIAFPPPPRPPPMAGDRLIETPALSLCIFSKESKTAASSSLLTFKSAAVSKVVRATYRCANYSTDHLCTFAFIGLTLS